ncbi:hypothetical protein CDAR_105251 [Caerostris darwini]|uniref:Uncharacterized protein n=1 Tax=Caerostris darwini TaxID=1538125 RepID=A0AAV4V4Z5_9ARAC|nr:hypothetical protein CDAR_105251 [Caerostris darwini]
MEVGGGGRGSKTKWNEGWVGERDFSVRGSTNQELLQEAARAGLPLEKHPVHVQQYPFLLRTENEQCPNIKRDSVKKPSRNYGSHLLRYFLFFPLPFSGPFTGKRGIREPAGREGANNRKLIRSVYKHCNMSLQMTITGLRDWSPNMATRAFYSAVFLCFMSLRYVLVKE